MDNSLNDMFVDSVFSKYSGGYTNSKSVTENDASESYMSFDSYLNLLVAQMSNQDFNDPMDDSEVLAQMAQYSMLEGIKNMTQQSSISYATSLVGKYVTISDNGGYITGKVDSINVSNGDAYLMIDGNPYKSGKVSDIVSDDIYGTLRELVGKTVSFKAYDSNGTESIVTQKVSNVVYIGGEGYAVVKGKLVPVSDVTVVDSASENGSTEKTEGSSDEEDGTVTEESAVTEKSKATYSEKSQSLIDGFMKELDEAEKSASVARETAEVKSVPASAAMLAEDDLITETAVAASVDYASGESGVLEEFAANSVNVSSDGDTILSRSYDERNIAGYSLDGIPTISASNVASMSANVSTVPTISTTPTVSASSASYSSSAVSGVDLSLPENSGMRSVAGYGGKYGVNIVNKSNTDITKRIKSGPVIAYTNDGKPVVEIGWSGLGRLGDVITLADGTQRVRVNLHSGRSVWFETTGKFTIEQLCNTNGPIGSFAGGVLTAEESSIRHYSDIFKIDKGTASRMLGRNLY